MIYLCSPTRATAWHFPRFGIICTAHLYISEAKDCRCPWQQYQPYPITIIAVLGCSQSIVKILRLVFCHNGEEVEIRSHALLCVESTLLGGKLGEMTIFLSDHVASCLKSISLYYVDFLFYLTV